MRKLRFTLLLTAGVLAIIAVFAVEAHYMGVKGVGVMTKLILFILLNLNLLAILTLMFFVGKSLFMVYIERKNRVLGSKFKTKFVLILGVLTFIPSVSLFIVSSGLVSNYLERWFDPQIRQALSKTVEIAQAAYEGQRKQALLYAEAEARGIKLPGVYSLRRVQEASEDISEVMKAAFEGKEGTEVISGGNGDTVRAAVPLIEGQGQKGILLVEMPVSKNITDNADIIQNAYQNYMTLDSWKTPIKANYIFVLGFFTLLIVFMALWVALRISRGIVDPIQKLVQSTDMVASGNFDINLPVEREDEIGLLVESFNNMVKDLKEGYRNSHIIENIIENINSGVMCLDTAGNVLTINSAACRILGISAEDYLNRNYSALISNLKSEELDKMIRKINIRDFRKVEKEVRLLIHDRQILLRIYISGLRDASSYLGTLVVFDDLTDVVRAQKALVWQEVARRIAHEIKNPLTPIKLSTEHMMKKWLQQDQDFGRTFERSTKTIIKEVESLRRLVDEFAKFGKMPEIQRTPAQVSNIIETAVSLYHNYKDLHIHISKPEREPVIEVDADQIKRVIINVIENAAQAMQHRGNISISLHPDEQENMLFIDIADDGPGIRDEDKEKLFIPYFSTKKDGTGLGLAIAQRVVSEHKGFVRVRDNMPKGSVFSIALPVKGE